MIIKSEFNENGKDLQDVISNDTEITEKSKAKQKSTFEINKRKQFFLKIRFFPI